MRYTIFKTRQNYQYNEGCLLPLVPNSADREPPTAGIWIIKLIINKMRCQGLEKLTILLNLLRRTLFFLSFKCCLPCIRLTTRPPPVTRNLLAAACAQMQSMIRITDIPRGLVRAIPTRMFHPVRTDMLFTMDQRPRLRRGIMHWITGSNWP